MIDPETFVPAGSRAIRTLVWGAFIFLTSGCLEPYVPAIIQENNSILVVDGFLLGNDSTVIRLSRTRLLDSPLNSVPELNATVEIEGEDGSSYPLKEKANGMYVIPPLNLEPYANFRLHIRANDSHEYLSDYVALKLSPPVDSVTWEEDKSLESIQFSIYTHDPENKTRYYLWTYEETWKYNSKERSLYYYENGAMVPRALANELYYCWKTSKPNNIFLNSTVALSADVVNDFSLYSIPQKSLKLYYGYSTLVKQYALTEEAYAYWTQTKKNSENLGTLTDPIPAQPMSNIRCISDPAEPVIGYFTASTVQQKRTFFSRQEITGPSTLYESSEYDGCRSELILLGEISDINLQGKLINDRFDDLITSELLGYIVYPAECLDCRMKGGVTTQPDYWK